VRPIRPCLPAHRLAYGFAFALASGLAIAPASAQQPDTATLLATQAEAMKAFSMIEGRGYDEAGKVRFNAHGIVSYNGSSKEYTLHSRAQRYVGDFSFRPTGDGYSWEIPIGAAILRYNAVVKDGELYEVGDRIVAGREPQRVFEMRLKRIVDNYWPTAGAVAPK